MPSYYPSMSGVG